MTDIGTILDRSTKDNPTYTINWVENKLNKYLEKKNPSLRPAGTKHWDRSI